MLTYLNEPLKYRRVRALKLTKSVNRIEIEDNGVVFWEQLENL